MSELRHYGVSGMKWGVRRYQNEDGTLTSAGEKRYNSGNDYRDAKHLAKDLNKLEKQYGQAVTEKKYQSGIMSKQANKAMQKGHVKQDGFVNQNSKHVKSTEKHALAAAKYADIANKIEKNQWQLMAQMAKKNGAAIYGEPKTRAYMHKGNAAVETLMGMGFGAIGSAMTQVAYAARAGGKNTAEVVQGRKYKAIKGQTGVHI